MGMPHSSRRYEVLLYAPWRHFRARTSPRIAARNWAHQPRPINMHLRDDLFPIGLCDPAIPRPTHPSHAYPGPRPAFSGPHPSPPRKIERVQ